MEIVQIAGIIFVGSVILILAYLYRESARISGQAKVEVEPVKVELLKAQGRSGGSLVLRIIWAGLGGSGRTLPLGRGWVRTDAAARAWVGSSVHGLPTRSAGLP